MKMYCLKCRRKVEAAEVEEARTKKGKMMLKGKCPDCGTTVCKFIKSDK